MSIEVSYPGVYIEEIPTQSGIIPAVPTSITAFLGRAPKGPLDRDPTGPMSVFSFTDFERQFGGLAKGDPMTYTVRDFFENGGNEAIIVRLFEPNFSSVKDWATSYQFLLGPILETFEKVKDPGKVVDTFEKNWKKVLQSEKDNAAFQALQMSLSEAEDAIQGTLEQAIAKNTVMVNNKPTYTITMDQLQQAATDVLNQYITYPAVLRFNQYAPASAAAGALLNAMGNALPTTDPSPGYPFQKAFFQIKKAAQQAAAAYTTGAEAQVVQQLQQALSAKYGSNLPPSLIAYWVTGVEAVKTVVESVLSGDTDADAKLIFEAAFNVVAAVAKAVSASGATPSTVAKAAEGAVNSKLEGAELLAAKQVATAAINASVDPFVEPTALGVAKAAVQSLAPAVSDGISSLVEQINPPPNNVLVLEAANPGAWGSYLSASVDRKGITPEVAALNHLEVNQLFNLTLTYTPPLAPVKTERYTNVSVVENAGDRRLDKILEQQSNLVRVPMDGDQPLLPSATPPAGASAQASTATDGQPLTGESYMGDPLLKTGIYALDKVDLFNLVCIPPDSRNPADPGYQHNIEIFSPILTYCVKRRAFWIIDPPPQWTDDFKQGNYTEIQLSYFGTLGQNARNAAVYFPKIVMPDPLMNGKNEVFAACGMIAGIMARTDVNRGVWKAPAGIEATLNGTTGLEVKVDDTVNGILNPLGINCLRTFPEDGSVVWGARTMRGADQLESVYKYVNVRRLTLFVEDSLYRGLRWAVFEDNDEELWRSMTTSITNFLTP